jgi:hypothetical protein
LQAIRQKHSFPLYPLLQTGEEGHTQFKIKELDSRKPAPDDPLFLHYRQDYYFFFLPRAGRSHPHDLFIRMQAGYSQQQDAAAGIMRS